jgi:hypothetical protein
MHTPRTPHGRVLTIEGVVLAAPMERHEHSLWRALRTADGRLVRVIMEKYGELARWVDEGCRVRVVGLMVLKGWRDGTYPTLSAHDRVEILTLARVDSFPESN